MCVTFGSAQLCSSYTTTDADGNTLPQDLPVLSTGNKINKNDYFLLSAGGKQYILQYKGTDGTNKLNPKIIFKNIGGSKTLEYAVQTNSEVIATIHLGGYSFPVKNITAMTQEDYIIAVDLNGDGVISDSEPAQCK